MLFKNGLVFTEKNIFEKVDILVKDGLFAAVGPDLPAQGEEVVDLAGKKVLPGLIDIHTHGCGMADFCDGTPEAFQTLAGTYIKAGVTTVCPTSMTLPPAQLSAIYKAYAAWVEEDHPGTRLIGINMEGPFISVAKKGAHEAQYVIPADMDIFNALNADSGNRIRLVDVAPEQFDNLDFIRQAKEVCTVSVAHTDGTYDQIMAGYKAGATSTTHLYNAMTGLVHREPGTVGAAVDSGAYAELICDGAHVHPAVLRLTFKAMGDDRIAVISDSLMAAGMPEGTICSLGGQEVVVKDGRCQLMNGVIAGSIANILSEIRLLISIGVPEESAIKCSTINPAKVAKIDHMVGSISVGKCADLLVLKEDYTPAMVYRDGIPQAI